MRNLFIAALAALLPTFAFAAAPADIGTLKSYTAQALSKCPDQKLTVERVDKDSPSGFIPYLVTQTSSDSTCGRRRHDVVRRGRRQTLGCGFWMGRVLDDQS